MNSDELALMTDDQIDYDSLSDDVLKELALGDELFIATSALVELRIRKSELAPSIAKDILIQSLGDTYLQATALSVLYDTDREQAVHYITQQLFHFNPHLLNTLMEIILDDKADFKDRQGLEIVKIIVDRCKEFDGQSKFPDPEVKHSFLEHFAILKTQGQMNYHTVSQANSERP